MTTFRIETTEPVNNVYEIKAASEQQAIALLDKTEPMATLPVPQGYRTVVVCVEAGRIPLGHHRQAPHPLSTPTTPSPSRDHQPGRQGHPHRGLLPGRAGYRQRDVHVLRRAHRRR